MDKEIKSKLMEILDFELDFSGLEETDFNFKGYIIEKYGHKVQDKLQYICGECGRVITGKEYVLFRIHQGDHENNDLAYVFLDTPCLFRNILEIIFKRAKK